MIGRIERENFTPSIVQLEALASILDFDLSDIIVEEERTNSYVSLHSETLSESEIEGIEKLFTMMLTLRQQIQLRHLFENESNEAR